MNKIIEIVKVLNEQNTEWREYLENKAMVHNRLRNESYVDETKKLIQQMLSEILNKQKQLIDEHKEGEEDELWEKIEKLVGSKDAKDAMRERNEDILHMYRNIRPLREAQENAIPLIIAVFEHLSVSYTPDFFQMGEQYGIVSEEDFIPVVLQLDRIVSVHVRRHYDKQTAQREFMKATGLGNEYALVYAALYEHHLEKLQHNVCIDKLETLTMQVEQLTREIRKLSKKIPS